MRAKALLYSSSSSASALGKLTVGSCGAAAVPEWAASARLRMFPDGIGTPAAFRRVLASSGVALKVVARCFLRGLPMTESSGSVVLPNMLLVMFMAGVADGASAATGGVTVPEGVPADTGDWRAPPIGSAECWRFS